MSRATTKIGLGLASLVALIVAGCHGAEPFGLGFDSGIFVTQGSGGAGAGTGGDMITVPGSGGAVGSGGAPASGGAGGAGEGDASVQDAPVVVDLMPELRLDLRPAVKPEGPFTLFNCDNDKLKVYKLDAPYKERDRVYSVRDLRVFQCKPFPYSGWCSIGAYEPSGPLGYWPDCWTPLGYCE